MANYFLWFIFGSVRNTLTDHPFSPQPSLVLFFDDVLFEHGD